MKRRSAQNSGKPMKGKPRGRPFAKGDGRINKGGRPKLPEKVKKYLEMHADELTIEALEALRKWTRGRSGKIAVPAALGLLKKTLPDGAIKIELTGADGAPLGGKEVTLDDSPGSLARVLAVLRSAGVLVLEVPGEGPDAQGDEIPSTEPH